MGRNSGAACMAISFVCSTINNCMIVKGGKSDTLCSAAEHWNGGCSTVKNCIGFSSWAFESYLECCQALKPEMYADTLIW